MEHQDVRKKNNFQRLPARSDECEATIHLHTWSQQRECEVYSPFPEWTSLYLCKGLRQYSEFPEIPRSVLQDSDSRSNNSLYKVMCLGTYTRPE